LPHALEFLFFGRGFSPLAPEGIFQGGIVSLALEEVFWGRKIFHNGFSQPGREIVTSLALFLPRPEGSFRGGDFPPPPRPEGSFFGGGFSSLAPEGGNFPPSPWREFLRE
jgi:hypothetical protein